MVRRRWTNKNKPLSLVLFSGTDDKLTAASVLAVGAAAMGRPVNIFLQYYALDAFRAGTPERRPRAVAEATHDQAPVVRAHPASTGASCCARRRTSARSTSRRARSRWTCST